MNLNNITNTGMLGIQHGMDQLRRDAHSVASLSAKGNEDTKALAKAMVDLNVDRLYTQASVKVVQASNDVIGSLLDIMV